MRILVLFLIPTLASFAEEQKTPEFHYTVFIGKPVQEVWDALTTKATIDRYYMAPVRTLELKQGGKIAYGTEDAEVITGSVLEYDPPKKFRHTFRFAGDSESTTTVTYAVTPRRNLHVQSDDFPHRISGEQSNLRRRIDRLAGDRFFTEDAA
jgi:uncharacterized protein YndB with AHSA1/START domain